MHEDVGSSTITTPDSIACEVDALAWDKQGGLLPVVVQDAVSLRVLMLGYMDRAALETTLHTRRVTFFSRSRQCLWEKGETSGNRLDLVSIRADCDNDTLLVLANPRGPTCHLDRPSCFAEAPGNFLAELDALIATRQHDRPEGSYTTQLFDAGVQRIAQKVGEEAVEVALASVANDDPALLGEAADLLYHLTVLLRARGLTIADTIAVLRDRHATTG
ncbi:MAG: bifunctional phosphoribosyl-AMP cyclohydrolase/phosphoribosyl-ATP diphosphatase HisIE [Lysobacteraceae bacterium]